MLVFNGRTVLAVVVGTVMGLRLQLRLREPEPDTTRTRSDRSNPTMWSAADHIVDVDTFGVSANGGQPVG